MSRVADGSVTELDVRLPQSRVAARHNSSVWLQ